MKNQLTELLTNYGEIGGIWFDGYWDQTAPEGPQTGHLELTGTSDEIYALIHKLQPQCLIGNNHHLTPFAGEDFQMFEKDLPGENKTGFSSISFCRLPLETCETMNNSWGFNITTHLTNRKTIDSLSGKCSRTQCQFFIEYWTDAEWRNSTGIYRHIKSNR